MRRAVYTIRDHEGWVRYVGSSSNPDVRFGSHWQSITPIGRLMREEHSAGRAMYLRVEEWFETTAEGYKAETQYIRGYARLSGEMLLNMRKPKGPARPAFETCMRDGCGKRLKYHGLCQSHLNEFYHFMFSLPKSQQQEYHDLCVENGLLIPEEEEEPVSCKMIADLLKAKAKSERLAKKSGQVVQSRIKPARLTNPVSIEAAELSGTPYVDGRCRD